MTEEIDHTPMQSCIEESLSADSGLMMIFGSKKVAPVLSYQSHVKEYKMNNTHRGICIIFVHTTLPKTVGNMVVSTKDENRLESTFSNLGFKVEVHTDLKAAQIEAVLKNVSKLDHGDADCFVCCLITRGLPGVYFAFDKTYSCDTLWKYFLGDKCKSLAGKPKLFFIEAYQGEELDAGAITHDGNRKGDDGMRVIPRIPRYADFLFAHSTQSGYYSWINKESGSWFVHSLCDCLEECRDNDILEVLTAVNNKVACNFISQATDSSDSGYKQMPYYTSMLTKKLYLKPKFRSDMVK